jgi:sRNA-binding protein
VLSVWKRRETYCRAVLNYSERIALDGTPCGEAVDDKARQLALASLKIHNDRHNSRVRRLVFLAASARAAGPARYDPITPLHSDRLTMASWRPRKLG